MHMNIAYNVEVIVEESNGFRKIMEKIVIGRFVNKCGGFNEDYEKEIVTKRVVAKHGNMVSINIK